MSTSDTPRIEGETVFTHHTEAVQWDTVTTEDTFDNLLNLFDGEGDLINLLIRELRATRIELNAARAELAERKPQPSGDEPRCPTCNGNDKEMACAYPSEGKPGCLRDARLSGDEQARFEAWALPILSDNPTWRESGPYELAWQAWQSCVAAHQPQGAPVAWRTVDADGEPRTDWIDGDGSQCVPAWPNCSIQLAYLASAWPPSPCPHLSTSKEGTSYCTLAETTGKE